MSNIAEARRVIEQACALGATDFCVCAGSRNSPLLAVLGAADLRLFSFVDERSAAFFAFRPPGSRIVAKTICALRASTSVNNLPNPVLAPVMITTCLEFMSFLSLQPT